VRAQGSVYARFRRALDGGIPTIALAAATEVYFVSLPDALEVALLEQWLTSLGLGCSMRYLRDLEDEEAPVDVLPGVMPSRLKEE
jgi:glucose-6-phosphate-specific signal transduction histidine kinase